MLAYKYPNNTFLMIYKYILKPIFFLFEPEPLHNFFIWFGEFLGRFSITRGLVRILCHYENPALEINVLGINFKNPIGLAAGFDKDVRLTKIMPEVGFGFMEVGAVTHLPCEGNKGRKLLRLPEDQSIIVYYGLKNIGSQAVYEKIKNAKFKIPVGLNIAKTNNAEIKGEKSVLDYVETYKLLSPFFSYVTINISCPNAQDGCTFQDPVMLKNLLSVLIREKKTTPVFLKISNHLTQKETDDILNVIRDFNLIDGFIISNLSKDRSSLKLKSSPERLNLLPAGGISGLPIQKKSNELIKYVYRKTSGRYVIIGVGGVFTVEDAYEKIKAGASLVQIITGLIYGGPMTVKEINRGLVRLLDQDGYKNIKEAIGKTQINFD